MASEFIEIERHEVGRISAVFLQGVQSWQNTGKPPNVLRLFVVAYARRKKRPHMLEIRAAGFIVS